MSILHNIRKLLLFFFSFFILCCFHLFDDVIALAPCVGKRRIKIERTVHIAATAVSALHERVVDPADLLVPIYLILLQEEVCGHVPSFAAQI